MQQITTLSNGQMLPLDVSDVNHGQVHHEQDRVKYKLKLYVKLDFTS